MRFFRDLAKNDEEQGSFGRHTLLLASLVALLVALPILRSLPGSSIRFSILLCLVLTAAIYVNSVRRWTLVAGVLIGGGAIVSIVLSETTGSLGARTAGQMLGIGLLCLTTLLMLNTLLRSERVSQDTIIGGICVYLMIGLTFAVVYMLAVNLEHSALMHLGVPLGDATEDVSSRSARLLYFSFVTLTTLGFGDITPSGEVTQMIVTGEAIIGQLYVAIFIARLMGLYISQNRAQSEVPTASVSEDDG
jgi:voltage-gated potassium channel